MTMCQKVGILNKVDLKLNKFIINWSKALVDNSVIHDKAGT